MTSPSANAADSAKELHEQVASELVLYLDQPSASGRPAFREPRLP